MAAVDLRTHRAHTRARAQVKGALRLEDNKNEEASLLAATAAGATATAAAPTSDAIGNETPMALSARTPSGSRDPRAATRDPITAASDGGGGGGGGRSPPNAQRKAAARASKLARAEAEAFADVQVHTSVSTVSRRLPCMYEVRSIPDGWWCDSAFGACACNVAVFFGAPLFFFLFFLARESSLHH